MAALLGELDLSEDRNARFFQTTGSACAATSLLHNQFLLSVSAFSTFFVPCRAGRLAGRSPCVLFSQRLGSRLCFFSLSPARTPAVARLVGSLQGFSLCTIFLFEFYCAIKTAPRAGWVVYTWYTS